MFLMQWLSSGGPVGSDLAVPATITQCVLHQHRVRSVSVPGEHQPGSSGARPEATRSDAGDATGTEPSSVDPVPPPTAAVGHDAAVAASFLLSSLCPVPVAVSRAVRDCFNRWHHVAALLLSPPVLLKDASARLGAPIQDKSERMWVHRAHREAAMAALGCLPDAAAWTKLRSSKHHSQFQTFRVQEAAADRDCTLAPIVVELAFEARPPLKLPT